MPGRRTSALGLIFGVATLWAATARAQLAATAALDSDFRWRGVSLSDGRPALSLDLSYDHPSGAYVGASGMLEAAPGSGVKVLGYVAYAGFAVRPGSGPALDVGVTHAQFTGYAYDRYAGYTEVYAGVTSGGVSGRLYFSPDYFGSGTRTLYAELNGAVTPAPDWRLFGHVGALAPLGGGIPVWPVRTRYDVRAGIAREFRRLELRLAVTAATRGGAAPAIDEGGRPTVVVGASLFF